ncbi:hypothetical protein TL16_g01021 [Triparma laevis f. inornata]|uniref:Potassium channel domain-containing protein n=1 Tax=Triparma laevis f. inornata TaxID=1714386 RepID=A0A9W6ZC03_9STRA|nr:hypothetical protein TL16_g01021 [Triparma laevis f. inornata]
MSQVTQATLSPKIVDKARRASTFITVWFRSHPIGEVIGQVMILILLVAIGAVAIGLAERWSFVDSVYFAVQTVTTIGYGDVSPETTAGKVRH